MSNEIVAITGLRDTVFHLKTSLGRIERIVLWVEWDHRYLDLNPPFHFSPAVQHADKLIYVLGKGDSGSSQLAAHLPFVRSFIKDGCEELVVAAPGAELDNENIFLQTKSLQRISLEELRSILGTSKMEWVAAIEKSEQDRKKFAEDLSKYLGEVKKGNG